MNSFRTGLLALWILAGMTAPAAAEESTTNVGKQIGAPALATWPLASKLELGLSNHSGIQTPLILAPSFDREGDSWQQNSGTRRPFWLVPAIGGLLGSGAGLLVGLVRCESAPDPSVCIPVAQVAIGAVLGVLGAVLLEGAL